MSITIHTFIHEPFAINTYLLENTETQTGFLVDIGRDVQPILDQIQQHGLTVDDLLHTHAFLEFLEGQPAFREQQDILAHMSPMDEFWLAHVDTQATILNVEHIPQAFVDQQVFPDDTQILGELQVKSISTPGNSPGGTCYYAPDAQVVFTGDVLYKGAIGPVDIPHGNIKQLIESIQTQLFTLPDETIVYPGRGPQTTIGTEKAHNTLTPIKYGTPFRCSAKSV